MPWGSLVLRSSGPSQWGHPWGSNCVLAHTLDWIVGLPEPFAPSSFAMRTSFWVETVYLFKYSIITKALTWPVLGFKFLRDGVTLFGSSVHTFCMYSIGTKVFTWFCLALCSFAMGSSF